MAPDPVMRERRGLVQAGSVASQIQAPELMPKHFENPQSPRTRLPGRDHEETTPPLPIAERVRQARLAANLTQEELGGDIFSRSYLSAVERGKMLPSIPALAVLAKRLGVPMGFLLGESEFDLSTLASRRANATAEAKAQGT